MLTFLYYEFNSTENFLNFPRRLRIKPSGLKFHESLMEKKKISNFFIYQ